MQRAIQLRPTTTNRLGLATLDVSQSVKSVRLSVSCLILCYVSEKFLSSLNYSPFSEQVGWPFRGSRADIQSARLCPSLAVWSVFSLLGRSVQVGSNRTEQLCTSNLRMETLDISQWVCVCVNVCVSLSL